MEHNLVGDDSTLQVRVPPRIGANLQETCALVQKLHCGFSLLRLLQDNPKMQMTAEGAAVQLKRPVEAIDVELCRLEELGLVSSRAIAGIIFFGLDTDPAKRKLVRDLLYRHDLWHV